MNSTFRVESILFLPTDRNNPTDKKLILEIYLLDCFCQLDKIIKKTGKSKKNIPIAASYFYRNGASCSKAKSN